MSSFKKYMSLIQEMNFGSKPTELLGIRYIDEKGKDKFLVTLEIESFSNGMEKHYYLKYKGKRVLYKTTQPDVKKENVNVNANSVNITSNFPLKETYGNEDSIKELLEEIASHNGITAMEVENYIKNKIL